MPADDRLIRRILALCAATGAACAGVLALTRGREAALSALAGAALGAANIGLMAWLARVALEPSRPQWQRTLAGLALSMKSLVLLVLISGLLLAELVRPIAFLAGLLMLLVSIVLAVLTQGDGDPPPSGRSSR